MRLRVKELAESKGMTQEDLHYTARIDKRTIERYWNDSVQRPDRAVLEALAAALQVTVKDLIADE